MDEVKWTVYEPGNPTPVTLSQSTSDAGEKHPYVSEKRITDGMTDSQKTFVRDYNSMRKFLDEHGLMEKK